MSKEEVIKQETWKPAFGYEGFYEVSTLGKIRSVTRTKNISYNKIGLHKGRELTPYKNKYGYMKVSLTTNDSYKTINVHKLIAETFILNVLNKPQVNHINGNKSDNRVENLEWCTRDENMQHAHKLGLMNLPKGENHFMYKIHPSLHPRAKSLINIKTKEIFGSIKEAYKTTGLKESTFRDNLRNMTCDFMYYDDYISNNGWIKVEDKLPIVEFKDKKAIKVWNISQDKECILASYPTIFNSFELDELSFKSQWSHWKRIQKDNKPLY